VRSPIEIPDQSSLNPSQRRQAPQHKAGPDRYGAIQIR
jgi:hypothetical protein